jgi:hypothetical protein
VFPPKPPPLLGFVGVAPIDIDALEVLGDAPAFCPNPVKPPVAELLPNANGDDDDEVPVEGFALDPKPIPKPVAAAGVVVAAGVLEPNPNEGAVVGTVVADPNAKGLALAEVVLAAGVDIEKPDVLDAPNPPNPVLAGAAAAADVAGVLAPKANVGAVGVVVAAGCVPNVDDGFENENIEDPVAGALVVAALAAGVPNKLEPTGAGVVVLPNNEEVAGLAGEVTDEPPNIDEVEAGAADEPPNRDGVGVGEAPKAGAGVDVVVTPNAGAAVVVVEAPNRGAVVVVVVVAFDDPVPKRLVPVVAAGFAPNMGAAVLAGMENKGAVGVVGAVVAAVLPNEKIGATVGLDASRVEAGADVVTPKSDDAAGAGAEAVEAEGRAKGFAMGAAVVVKGLLTGAVVVLVESDEVAVVEVGIENRLEVLGASPPVLAAGGSPNKLVAGFVAVVAGVAVGAWKTNPPGAAGVEVEEVESNKVGLAAVGVKRLAAGAELLTLGAGVDEGCPNENMAGAAVAAGLVEVAADDDGAPKVNSAGTGAAAGFVFEDEEIAFATATANMFGTAAAVAGLAPGLGLSQAAHLSSSSLL